MNFQITVLAASIVMAPFLLFSWMSSWDDLMAMGAPSSFPVVMVVTWLVWMGFTALVWTCAIIGAVRAGQDKEWRYPVTIRWVKEP